MNKYEQLIEHIINDDEAKARALFHQIVVERSREIYESLMDEAPGADQEGPADLLAAVEQEIARPGSSTDNLRDVLNATFGSNRSPEFKKARAVIGKYLDLVDTADVGSGEDGIAPMGGGNISRHIQQHDLTDYLQHAAAMLDKVGKGSMGEAVSNNQVEDLTAEVTGDEEGMHEADDDMDMPGDDMDGAPGDDLGDLDGDMGSDSDAPATKSDIMDLESAIDELKAEFDRLMNDVDQDGDGDHDMEDHDAEDADSDDEESGEEPGEDDDESDDEAGKNPFAEGKKAKKANMTEAERIREYVEKVGTDWDKGAYKGPKGENVGTGNKSERQGEKNTKSPVAGKNDMGGTTANILSGKGATEATPDGQRPNGKAGGFLKSPQEIDVAKRNVNKPGGNKGAQNYYDTKASAKSGEQSVNANSPLNGAPGRAK
jgi:hypothetical protein